ncbi:MAG: tRNA lysidine(34) synthetase TilS [Rickettsiales bacterium]|jgi:tRNA(Ile)-lysidine synthase|nr:tRNA lysidine(34) synthetase TilS [Rickettsiales bacterium]
MIDFNITELQNANKILIAVSGGIDSLAMTFLINEWIKQNDKDLFTITIDHKIRIPTSTNEANYIHKLLSDNNIKHVTKTCPEGIHSENEAREYRYKFIFEYMKEQKIDVVLLAHHLQDQVENFLIRLFRGSGIRGLSSMQKVSKMQGFTLIRPLLNARKEDLKQYLSTNNIKWCEDDSNEDEKYLRNKIRNFLNSFEEKNNIIRRINNSIDTFQKANEIVESNIVTKGANLYTNHKIGDNVLHVNFLNSLNEEEKHRVLLNIVKNVSKSQQPPRFEKLKRLLDNIDTIKKYTFAGCVFEKKGDTIIVYKEKKVKVIGITGLVASGKTTMVEYLRKKGYKIFESDDEVKKLYQEEVFLKQIKELFGTNDKSNLAKIVFNDVVQKGKLESLIHPIIENKCNDFIEQNNNERYIFLDVPLLYEVGWDKKCNKVILIVIDGELERQRFIKRGGTVERFEIIIKNQNGEDGKRKKADYVIENNGNYDDFYEKIDKLKFVK